MLNRRYAPWTKDEVAMLKARQDNNFLVPYICDEGHILEPTVNGWKCKHCKEFEQNWCYSSHLNVSDAGVR